VRAIEEDERSELTHVASCSANARRDCSQ